MTRHAVMSDSDVLPPSEPSDTLETLEERVRRLEEAVAALQDTRVMEERVTARLLERLPERAGARGADEPMGLMASASRLMLPRVLDMGGPTIEGSASALPPPSRPWLLTEMYHEIISMIALFVDYRYRASWTARLVLPMAGLIFLFSWIFVSSMVLIGPIVDRLIEVLLVVMVYKVLAREAAYYRAMFPRSQGVG